MRKPGFALPTVLLSAVVMLMILVTTVSVTTSINSGLRDQRYTELASLAADAGTVMATACLNQNGGQATWTNAKPLKPNTDCSGNVISGQSGYVLEQADVRTYFEVSQPLLGAGNVPVSAAVKGYSEVLRSSSGVAWRVWSSDTSVALVTANDGLPVGSYVEGAWTTAPAGYLLADGAAVSRTTYANLFAVIGTSYGAGDGSTTFNLPDTRGRVVVNKSTNAEFDTLGELSGSMTNTHDHWTTVSNDGGATYITACCQTASRVFSVARVQLGGGNAVAAARQDATYPTTVSIVQPSIVANRAIKY